MQEIYNYIEANYEEAVADLALFCRQPSVSAQGTGLAETASLLARIMDKYGVKPRIMPLPSGGYPVVYGELEGASPVTLLFYNHYDVQPAEPLELWTTPPFEPDLRQERIWARGVSDNKGDIIARLLAFKAFLEVKGHVPVSVKFVVEGEEEIGSPNLPPFIRENRDLLEADACLWEGGEVNYEGQPVIILGVKGILYVQLEAVGARRDLHSSLAPIVPNPAWRMVWALASLKDADERVLIDGFYDDARPPTPGELSAVRAIPPEDEKLKEGLGLKEMLRGAEGFELRSRLMLEPACTICGIISGYTGRGTKTVLPAVSRAKVDFRLVPNQRPDDILSKLRRHLDRYGFGDISISRDVEGENPARTPPDSPFVGLVSTSAREVYGLEPVIMPNMAGSGPMFFFIDTLGLPVASSGVAHPESRAHAPDENIRLRDFVNNAKHIATILDKLAAGP
ncbi:M20/M25/M40 family metallo-hydrolase [Chloroflexota bacterium]